MFKGKRGVTKTPSHGVTDREDYPTARTATRIHDTLSSDAVNGMSRRARTRHYKVRRAMICQRVGRVVGASASTALLVKWAGTRRQLSKSCNSTLGSFQTVR